MTLALYHILIVITGKSNLRLIASGLMSLGPKEPQPPITFAQITKYLLVSALLGPTAVTHHPSLFVTGLVQK